MRPRHLAGGGDLAHITDYLAGAGWKNRTSRSGSPVCFESPDRSVRIGYISRTSSPMWIISGTPPGRPAWNATLGAAIPVEILAGFTDALTRPRPAHAPDVLGQLTARGWAPGKGGHPAAGHPDGSALLQYRREGEHAIWWASAHTPGTNDGPTVPLWNAGFSEHTPLHALETFAAALADPQPILRPPGRIPFVTIRHAAITPYPVLPSQLNAARRARTAAARAATWARSARAFARPRPRPRAGTPLSLPPAAPPRPAHPTRSR
ncbi:DUF317 domain-containing protein [Streptomyces sp. HPF1205]|uniref:DUF317 domain-containing protein n=1 Tax=Streptomyces sp. HPF1205 TaxID=2873262 RepID=UPI001CED9843|nr:DUF317 domain-containing protein [Streptomyces sp. HPF1205]